jgi:ribose 1,5-bisphosphokinase
MNSRLIYVVGPSGAGKDSILDWLRHRLAPAAPIAFARRTIDRPVQPAGEQHESVDATSFESLLQTNAFAMHWRANGRLYGVRHGELEPLQQAQWLFVNGSRTHLEQALREFNGMRVLHITASTDILRARLLSRQRESPALIEARVQRAVSFAIEPDGRTIELRNDTSLDAAGADLMKALAKLPGWPAS